MDLPSATRHNLLILALIAVHPIWLVVRLSASLPDDEVAYLFDLLLCAVLASLMRAPAPSTALSAAPPTLQTTLSGVRFVVPAQLQEAWIVRQALLATIVSAVGMMVAATVGATLDPDSYSDLYWNVPAGVYQVGVGLWTVACQSFLLGLVVMPRRLRKRPVEVRLEGRLLRVDDATLPLSGSATTQLSDGVLVVTDGAGSLEVPGPESWLRWLAEQIEAIEPAGDDADVPEAMRQVLRARATE